MAAAAGAVRAGRAFIELFADKSKLVRTLRTVETDLSRFAGRVRTLGRSLFVFGSAMAGGLLVAAKTFASTGVELDRVSRGTGLAADKLSSLQYAATVSGASVGALNGAIQGIQQTLVEAAKGSDSAAVAFARLGINGRAFAQLNPDDQLKLVADRIRAIRNPVLQAALANDVLGGSAAELLPLLQKGSQGISELQAEAYRLGVVLSAEDTAAAVRLHGALSQLWQLFLGVKNAIAAALAPELIDLAGYLAEVLAGVITWIRENRGLVVSFAKIVGVVLATGVGLTALSYGLSIVAGGVGLLGRGLPLLAAGLGKLLGAGTLLIRLLFTPLSTLGRVIGGAFLKLFSVVGSALSGFLSALVSGFLSLMTPIGVLGLALVALGAYFFSMSGTAQKAVGDVQQLWKDLQRDTTDALDGIADALAAGNLALAAEILWLTLKLEWQRGINLLNGLWQEWKAFTLTTWNEATSNLSGFFINATAAIAAAWTETTDFLADVWSLFTSGLRKGWNSTIGFIQKAWVKLKGLFDDDVNVDAEVNRINSETEDANAQVDTDRDKAIGDRDQERRRRLQQIENERKGSIDQNEGMRNQENERIRKEADAAIAATQADVDAARKRFDDAREQARKEREESKRPKFAGVEEQSKGLGFAQTSVTGTFSSRALGGLGAGNPAQQTAKNTARIAEQQEKTNTILKNQTGPVFGRSG